MVRFSLFAINIALLGGVVYFVSGASTSSDVLTPQVALVADEQMGQSASRASSPLDQLSSAEIAVHVSRMTQLETAIAVTNQADSVSSQSSVMSHDDTVVSKPQIVYTDTVSKRDIRSYTVKEGDTVSSLAKEFGVSSDAIRWSNDLTAWSTLSVGDELAVPPIDGIVYTVEDGDTPEKLADTYQSNAQKITAFNDAEIDGLVPGEQILIPGGEQPAPSRRSSGALGASYFGFAGGTGSYGNYNGYVYGYCTWHVANRRAAIGKPLPNNLGHARTWAPRAQAFGITTSATPIEGAVLWHKDTSLAWGLGHVGFVERVNDDGSILVSDMNYPNWNVVSQRTIQPSELGAYTFIQ